MYKKGTYILNLGLDKEIKYMLDSIMKKRNITKYSDMIRLLIEFDFMNKGL